MIFDYFNLDRFDRDLSRFFKRYLVSLKEISGDHCSYLRHSYVSTAIIIVEVVNVTTIVIMIKIMVIVIQVFIIDIGY